MDLSFLFNNFFKIRPYVIAEDIKVNFPTELEVPSEIGTDRIVNALCAWRLYNKPAVIIDFGVTVMVPDTLVESHKTPFVVTE
mgnify:CR=1 FL=1